LLQYIKLGVKGILPIYKLAERSDFILGIEPDKQEDISDLEKLLNPPKPVQAVKIGRNDPCPCGSGKKYKKCCG